MKVEDLKEGSRCWNGDLSRESGHLRAMVNDYEGEGRGLDDLFIFLFWWYLPPLLYKSIAYFGCSCPAGATSFDTRLHL